MHLLKDAVLLVVGGVVGAGGLKALEAKAEADLSALKADVAAELAKVAPDLSALKAKVSALLAKL